MTLSNRIDEFIEKQGKVRFTSEDEARQYGIKLPPRSEGPKWDAGKQKTETAEIGEKPQDVVKPKEVKKPKDILKPKVTPKPVKMKPKVGISEIVQETGEQLSPKGPFRSPSDIVEDVKESKRLSNKVKDFLSRTKVPVKEK